MSEPRPSPGDKAVVPLSLLLDEQSACWQRGEHVLAEVYLQRCPQLADDLQAVLDLIYHEIVLREKAGEQPTLAEYLQRFPRHAEQIRDQLAVHAALAGVRLVPAAVTASPAAQPTAEAATLPPTHEGEAPATLPPALNIDPWPALPSGNRVLTAKVGVQVPGYEILGELGRGGMGVVYKARQVGLGRLVALKMILSGEHSSSEERERFRTETQALARLQHPNIVAVHEVGEHDGNPFFSLEFCTGGSLDKKLNGTPLPPLEAARLVQTLALAVQAAHEKNVIHRDLKPANVMLSESGQPKIGDFGLARKIDETGQTASGAIMGTPSYMAPEQTVGKSKELGPACDVYSLGAILYELLTGRPPFKGATARDTILQVVSDEPVPPRQLQSKTPRDLETICLKCLEKEPARRFASSLELAQDLALFQQGRPIRSRPVTAWERMLKWGKRRPTTAALLGAVAILALLLGTGLAVTALRERHRVRELREFAEGRLTEARAAAENKQWHTTDALLNTVQQRIVAEPALIDLFEQVRAMRTTYERFRAFLRQRDQTLFQGIFITLFPGLSGSPPDSLPDVPDTTPCYLSEAQRLEMVVGRAETFLVRADVMIHSGIRGDPAARRQQAARALEFLEQADQQTRQMHGYHLRRAYYLGLLGKEAERQEAQEQAEKVAPDSGLDHFLSGLHLYVQGQEKLEQAARCFEGALRRQPDHFWSQFALAVSQLGLRNWLAAGYCLDECVKQRPTFPWALLLRGSVQVQLREFNRAEEDFRLVETILRRGQETVGAVPGLEQEIHAVLSVNRGTSCVLNNQWLRAEQHFTEAVRQQPGLCQAHAGLLYVLTSTNRLAEADRRFPAFAALNPPAELLADYHVRRARQLSLAGKNEEALQACSAAEAVQKTQPDLFAIRGEVLLRLGRDQEAADSFDHYLALGGPPLGDVYKERGQAHVKLGRHREAADDFGRALDLERLPTVLLVVGGPVLEMHKRSAEAELRVYRGMAWLASDAFGLALQEFETARRLKPNSSDAWTGCGVCLVSLDRVEEAIAAARKAVQLKPTTPETQFNVGCIFARALAKVRSGKNQPQQDLEKTYRDEAIGHVRTALEMAPRQLRPALWKRWRQDSWLNPLRDSSEFLRLDKEF